MITLYASLMAAQGCVGTGNSVIGAFGHMRVAALLVKTTVSCFKCIQSKIPFIIIS